MRPSESQESIDIDEYFDIFGDNNVNQNRSNSSALKQFLQNTLSSMQTNNYKTKDIKLFTKFIRQKLHLNKKPKEKGYGQYFTEEQLRYQRI